MGIREQKECAVLTTTDQDDASQDQHHPVKQPMTTSASPPLLLVATPPSAPSSSCSSSCSPVSTSGEEESSPLLGSNLAESKPLTEEQLKASKEEMELLARLELQNRLLEADAKSVNSLTSGHSRKSSSTSLVSVNSSASQAVDEDGEDIWQVWGTVVSEWETFSKKKASFVKDLVRRGIPHHFRSIVWQLLCSAQSCPARELYTDYLKSTSPCEKVILRDIARTYPEHDFFREKDGPGQESLFNVMKAYSLHDREVGYCQGSAFIVGLLLLQMPEEDAFSVMVRLMEDYRLREMYKPSMAELGLCMYQLECIVQEQIPEIYMHFQAQSFHTSMYASSWFLTLFTSSLPLSLACRVMDLFLSEGMEIIFRIGLAILQYCKEDLLQYDMEGMLRYFQKEMPVKCEADPDYLVSLAMQVKYNSKKMKKLEKDYTSYKAKEQEDMVELRRLRTENKLLRQRIEHLESESSSLADRLIQDQVTRAQEAEDNYAVNRELSSLKQQELLTRQELERAYHRIKELHEANSQNEETIKSLQEELIAVKLKKAEARDTMQDLLQRIQDLEMVNKCLKDNYTDTTMIRIQEELISVKLREAEAQQYIKELLEKVSELEVQVEGVKGKFGMNNILKLRPNFMSQKSENEKDSSAAVASLEKKVKEAENKRFEMELEHEKQLSEMKNRISVLESQNEELTKSNQMKLAAENEDLKILCKRVTELQVKLAEERDLNKKLSSALENKEGDANHNTEGNYAHIENFLEALRQSRSNILSDEGNFEQIYKLRLNPKDLESCTGRMESIEEKN